MPRWLRIAGIALLVVVLLAAAAFRVVDVGVTEFYSRGWISESAADAARRGVLRAQPTVIGSRQLYEGDSLSIAEAWIEQITRIEYKWYLQRRVIALPRHRLVLRAAPGWRPTDYSCDRWLVYSDTIRLGESGSRLFFDEGLTPPFPDTVRLGVVSRSAEPGCGGSPLEATGASAGAGG